MRRREFIQYAGCAGMAFAVSGRDAWSQLADSRIEILLNEPIAQISPMIYGQFTEHIGGVIYDGVWVGRESKIPNVNGIRKALVDKLREIRVPVIRWPGGCAADSYDWRDGVGPAEKRPRRTNFWEIDPDASRLHEKGRQIFETNEFGTDEFMQLCKLAGAQPYVAANLRSLSPLDFDHWVEYCNSPKGSTTLAEMRAAGGSPDPFGVRYWGVGNESWGCGGNFTPEEYASEFRRFTTWVPRYGVDLQFIGSGPNGDDVDWTQRFFEQISTGKHSYSNPSFAGWSIHHYAWNLSRGKTQDWIKGKGDALQFDAVDWYEVLRESDRMQQIINDHWTVMGEYDTARQVKLVVDEYGPWYREGSEVDISHLFGQQITIRDALATALTLDTFNRNAEKVAIAASAQLVNNINTLFLAHEDQFITTPNFNVFAMYANHQGARALRTEFSSPRVHYVRDGQPATFWGLQGSASQKENAVTLTVVNTDLERSKVTQIAVRGGHLRSASGMALKSPEMHAHNTFAQPDAVQPANLGVSLAGDLLTVEFPAASVSKIEIVLAEGT
jgi:alpha-L-arabinofuranosidase